MMDKKRSREFRQGRGRVCHPANGRIGERKSVEMITIDTIRGYALALPEVEEKPHFGRPGFRVRDKLFVSVHLQEDNPFAIVHVSQADAAAAVTDDSDVFEEVWRNHGQKRIFVGLRVDLAKVSPERYRQLVETAWRNRAPKRLVAAQGF